MVLQIRCQNNYENFECKTMLFEHDNLDGQKGLSTYYLKFIFNSKNKNDRIHEARSPKLQTSFEACYFQLARISHLFEGEIKVKILELSVLVKPNNQLGTVTTPTIYSPLPTVSLRCRRGRACVCQ